MASPHKVRVRLPKPYHDESFEDQYGSALEYWEHVQDVLRAAGVEVSDDA